MTNEVGPYVEHRMKLAGSDLLVFEPEALEAIAMASSGVPRRLHRALLALFGSA